MPWYENCYSRLLVDNHITDLKPKFMSKYEPSEYARIVKIGGTESAMVYACCHNGNCYYPTKYGHQHANLNGRDIFGETVNELKKLDIVPIAYYTVVFHNDSAKRFPHAVPKDVHGSYFDGRYHYGCPNHPDIREFYCNQLREIAQYPVSGVFIDMTYWPRLCHCDACREKFRNTCGLEIPEKIDFSDPHFLAFQHFRENSLGEFARELTGAVKAVNPDLSVTHQFSPVLHGWQLGQGIEVAKACDYCSGDFYGGKRQQRLAVKIFDAYSTHRPVEFMTSRSVSLKDHTSTKSDDELFLHALTTLANGGAYFFIDAINPDGTLEEAFYRRLGNLNQRLKPFKEMVAKHRPEMQGEVGVYFAVESCVNLPSNGIPFRQFANSLNNMDIKTNTVVEEMLGITGVLQNMHIPHTIITQKTCDYSHLKVLIVPNANHLPAGEYEKFRKFTAGGGILIATGHTSIFDRSGKINSDYLLSDVFGVKYSGKNTGLWSYMEFPDGSKISSHSIAPLAEAAGAEVLAKVNLPDFPVGDPVNYASIHSNPPGECTDFAAYTKNSYGQGTCYYFYSNILGIRQHNQQSFAANFFKPVLPEFVTGSRNLPGSTEITLLKSTTSPDTWLLGLVNYQDELPNIPLRELEFTIKLPENCRPVQITRASDGQSADFQLNGNSLTVKIDYLENGEIFEIK